MDDQEFLNYQLSLIANQEAQKVENPGASKIIEKVIPTIPPKPLGAEEDSQMKGESDDD